MEGLELPVSSAVSAAADVNVVNVLLEVILYAYDAHPAKAFVFVFQFMVIFF